MLQCCYRKIDASEIGFKEKENCKLKMYDYKPVHLRYVDWRKSYNLKAESSVLFGDYTENYIWEISSQIVLRSYSEEVMDEPGYVGVLCWKKKM